MNQKSTNDRPPVRVGLISLGCAKNLVDAEIMVGTLLKDGIEITNDSGKADVLIVNTCSFIDSAQEESVDTILESAGLRLTANPHQGLIVSGCLPQRFRDELPKLLPEVDAFIGIDQVPQISGIVRQALARRAEKLKHSPQARTVPDSRPPGKDSKVMTRLAELDAGRAHTPHDSAEAIRGTEKFGRTKTVVPTPDFPAADAIQNNAPLFDVTARPQYIPDYATPRFRLTPKHFAYVKIAEGCNHPCSFCIIPRMRGTHRSRAQSDVIAEAKSLLEQGVRELNLISQDSTYYGLDLRANRNGGISAPEKFNAAVRSLPAEATTICTLLRELNELPGDFWIRLLYTHPAHWTDELIKTIAECPKVARYVDIPLQHIHETMLERMRRETSRQYIEDLLARIRAGVPGIALRTTFIVGFPGETDARFESLLDFIRATRFERLGVFTYSQESGTRAGNMAEEIRGNAPRPASRERAVAVQHENAIHVSESFVGKELKALIDEGSRVRANPSVRVGSVPGNKHGLISSAARTFPHFFSSLPATQRPLVRSRAAKRTRRTLTAGSMCAAAFPPVPSPALATVGHTDYDLIAEPVNDRH